MDRNGYLNQNDFKDTLKALKKFRKWRNTDPRFVKCERATRMAWQELREKCDLDRSHKVHSFFVKSF